MSSLSIGIVNSQNAVERVVALEDVGKQIVNWGLIVVLAWIGAMKLPPMKRWASNRWSPIVLSSVGCTISSVCDRSQRCSDALR